MSKLGRMLRATERRLRMSREVPTHQEPHHTLLASFPKSGNTWVRFILSNLSREVGGHSLLVDFHTVARYVPEIRRNRSLEGRVETPGFPLFLKTHFPYIRSFSSYPSIVVIRDPADTLVSYHRHLRGAAGKRLPPMHRFVRHWRYGIDAWHDWYSNWIVEADAVVRYEDLLKDPVSEARRILDTLGVSIGDELLEASVASSSKDEMRKAQRERGDPHPKRSDYEFVGKATSGVAREMLNAGVLTEIYESAGELGRRFGYGTPE